MARCEKQEVYYQKPKAQHKINEESFRWEKPGHPSAVPDPWTESHRWKCQTKPETTGVLIQSKFTNPLKMHRCSKWSLLLWPQKSNSGRSFSSISKQFFSFGQWNRTLGLYCVISLCVLRSMPICLSNRAERSVNEPPFLFPSPLELHHVANRTDFYNHNNNWHLLSIHYSPSTILSDTF